MNENNKKVNKHESFGMISISRGRGTKKALFGSSIMHSDTIFLEISRAESERDLNETWVHDRENLIEVEMSLSQFAEMITSLNSTGVPVTIRQFNGKILEKCPFIDDTKAHKDEFKEEMDKMNSNVIELIKKMEDKLSTKKPLGVKEQKEIKDVLESVNRELVSNMKFRVDQFDEHMENVIHDAKCEIEAFIGNRIHGIVKNGLVVNDNDMPKFIEDNKK